MAQPPPETRGCPAEFQERITQMFGTNQFGDPHFKIVWGQSVFIRMGNIWRDAQGTERKGYQERYQAHGQPCWVIMRWKAPSEYGSPEAYYANTYDEVSGLYITGEYPWRGRYEVVQPLISKEVIDGELVVEHFPLSHFLIDTLIPLMIAWQNLSEEEKQASREANRVREEQAENAELAEKMMANLPSFYGPVSYSKQGCRTSLLDRKMSQIQKVWDQFSRDGRRPVFGRGVQQGSAPVPVALK